MSQTLAGPLSPKSASAYKGIGSLVLAMLIISIQNVAVKWLDGSYPVLEIVVFRNIVALPFTLLFFLKEGKRGFPKTAKPRLEIVRGIFLFVSFTAYMMGVVALPLAQVESIRFSGPLMITVLSILLLRERVALSRWFALALGFSGVLLIVRPGPQGFNSGTVFILLSALFYALTVITTRKLKDSDSSAVMAFYSSLVYLACAVLLTPVTLLIGALGIGGLNIAELKNAGPGIAFLFHGWAAPTTADAVIMGGLGIVWAGWSYFMSRAYASADASALAGFEYLSLPINTLWGFALWREVPSWGTVAGAALILSAGIFLLRMDRKARAVSPA